MPVCGEQHGQFQSLKGELCSLRHITGVASIKDTKGNNILDMLSSGSCDKKADMERLIYNLNQKYIDSLIHFFLNLKTFTANSPIESNQRGGTLVVKSNNDKNLLDFLLKKNVYYFGLLKYV